MIDIHIHTLFSEDGKEDMEQYAALAYSRGDKALGFSDHCEYHMEYYAPGFPRLDVGAFLEKADAVQKKYPSLRILRGLEFGYGDDAVDYYADIASAFDLDYAIMSVHTVEGRGDCYSPDFYAGITREQAFLLYLNEALKSVRCKVNFNVLGHFGYISRYAPYPDKRLTYAEFAPQIDEILTAVIDRGAAMELNTSTRGLDSDFVTDVSVVERYIALGGKYFSFGSDAHHSSRYAENACRVRKFLADRGLKYTVHFERGEPVKDYFDC